MEAARGGRGKISDLLSQARDQPGLAVPLLLSLLARDEDETEEEWLRRSAGMALVAETMAHMRAMRLELRAFLRAMAQRR